MDRLGVFRLVTFAYDALTHTTMINADVLPKEGPFILAVNHMSRLDFPALLYTMPRRLEVKALIADKYKKYKVFAYIANKAEMIWIDRERADFAAMKTAMQWIKAGHILTLSPEGTRSKDGQMIEAKPGIVLLASKTHVPVCTASITGTRKFMNDFCHFRKPVIKIVCGPQFDLPVIDPENRDASLRAATDEVMCRLAAMLPEANRGYYKDFPRVQELREEYSKMDGLNIPAD